MQVTLNVDGSHLDSEVKDLLKTLTPEQMSSLATQMLQKSLDNCSSELMREAARVLVLEEYNKGKSERDSVRWNGSTWITDGYISYDIRDMLDALMKERTNASTFFRNNVLSKIMDTATAQTEQMVKEDPVVKEAIDTALKGIKEEMPKIVHDAVMLLFCKQMQGMSLDLASSLFQTKTNAQLLTDLQTKLQARGY